MANLSDQLAHSLVALLANPAAFDAAMQTIDQLEITHEHMETPGAQALLQFFIDKRSDTTLHELTQHLAKSNGVMKDYLGYLTQLPTDVSDSFAKYAPMIKTDYLHRQIMSKLGYLAQVGHDLTIAQLEHEINAAQQLLLQMETGIPSGLLSHAEAAGQAIEQVIGWEAGQNDTLPLGFECFARRYIALLRGQLNIIAAPSGVGKSALATGIAIHNAGLGNVVANFNMEMEAVETALRMASMKAGINQNDLRFQKPHADYEGFVSTLAEQAPLPIEHNASPSLTIRDLGRLMRAVNAKHGRLDLVVVDYARLLETQAKDEISAAKQIGRGLVELSKMKDSRGKQPALLVIWDVQKTDGKSFWLGKTSLMYGGHSDAGLILTVMFPFHVRNSHETELRGYCEKFGYTESEIEAEWYAYHPDPLRYAAWVHAAKQKAWINVAKSRHLGDGMVIQDMRYDGTFTRWYEERG